LGVDTKAGSERDLKNHGDNPLLSLPFDHYQRYALTQELVRLLGPGSGSTKVRILDVGGSSSSLKHFLPEADVVLADVQGPPKFTHREIVPFRHDGYVLAVGQSLPFADSSFDIVTAHDTLEHVPAKHRELFLHDMLRVARQYVILHGPVFQPETAAAERRLAEYMQRGLGGVNTSLVEHIELGLPEEEAIVKVLSNGGSLIIIDSGNLFNWFAMMVLKHYVIAFPESDWLHEVMDRVYNLILSPHDSAGLCYRKCFVVAKNARDAPALEAVAASIESRRDRSASPPSTVTLEPLLQALEEHASAVGKRLPALAEAVSRLEHELAEREAAIKQRDDALSQVDAQLESQIEEHKAERRRLERELETIRSSTGYRIIGAYRRLIPTRTRSGAAHRALVWPLRWLLDMGSRSNRRRRRDG
jgi:ubiquinone/menaquinone biosynthesis C-methylase UbiE